MNFFIIDKKELIKKINTNSFRYIISTIIIFFSVIIYLSLPSFYNYETYNEKLKSKLAKEFKLNFKNINGINYSFFPQPHFIVEKVSVGFFNNKNDIAEINNFKINLSLKNLNRLDRIEISEIIINKANFNITFEDLKSFFNHMHSNIHKPILIKNSNFFLKNQNGEILSISKSKVFNYFIDKKNKEKKIRIDGNLFGTNFKYSWNKSYAEFGNTKSKFTFDNPNIEISSMLKKNFIQKITLGNSKITFLNNITNLNYQFDKNVVEFLDNTIQQNKSLRNKINLLGMVHLKPFFFDLDISLANLKLDNILQVIFFNLNRLENKVHSNFNGNFKIKLNNLNNKIFENLNFNLAFSEGNINFKDTKIDFKNIGKIYFNNIKTLEKDDQLYLITNAKIQIDNKKQFFQRFQITKKNRFLINDIYVNLEINLDDNKYYLSNFYLKDYNDDEEFDLTYNEITNFQKLTLIVREEFSNFKRE